MIESGQKTSLLVPSQLPEFIRDNPDYSNFVLFLQAYYEWLEETNNVTDRTKNLLNYKDIDETTTEFLNYFYNDFLSYFPTEILADKQKVIKIAKELYQSKGTPASFQFLFMSYFNFKISRKEGPSSKKNKGTQNEAILILTLLFQSISNHQNI